MKNEASLQLPCFLIQCYLLLTAAVGTWETSGAGFSRKWTMGSIIWRQQLASLCCSSSCSLCQWNCGNCWSSSVLYWKDKESQISVLLYSFYHLLFWNLYCCLIAISHGKRCKLCHLLNKMLICFLSVTQQLFLLLLAAQDTETLNLSGYLLLALLQSETEFFIL